MTDQSPVYSDGAAYERTMGYLSARVGAIFLEWLSMPNGLRWIDIGCGNGAFTEQIVGHCAPAEVHALDPSEPQLSYARSRPALKQVQFQQGDAQSLSYPDAAFDVATMALVISLVPEPGKVIAEMKRVVEPGGYIATYIWDIGGGGLPVRWAFEAMRAVGATLPPPPEIEVSSLASLRALWDGACLEDVETSVIPIDVTYSDFDDFWQSHMTNTGPPGKALKSLSVDMRERVRKHLYEKVPRDAGGRVTYGAHANAIKGRVALKK